MSEKPKCELVGTDGNIFALGGRAQKVLRQAGLHDEAKEMIEKIFKAESYDQALSIICEYVDAY